MDPLNPGFAKPPSSSDLSGEDTSPIPDGTILQSPDGVRDILGRPADVPVIAGGIRIPGYEILAELGRGGMGIVCRARHIQANVIVALKMISRGGLMHPEERTRFEIEARSASQLDHPNIIRVYETGEFAEVPWYSMEICNGGSLTQRYRGRATTPSEAAKLLEMLAKAMAEAHRVGIVHRDLKPSNILFHAHSLGENPTPAELKQAKFAPKITDFGLAKDLKDSNQNTVTGAILGTPAYMSPEQAQGQSRMIGPGTDIWGLGAIFYELLTGKPPFQGETVHATINLVVGSKPVSPRLLQPGIPEELEMICLKCLRKKPEQRYANAGELAADLRQFLSGDSGFSARLKPVQLPSLPLPDSSPALPKSVAAPKPKSLNASSSGVLSSQKPLSTNLRIGASLPQFLRQAGRVSGPFSVDRLREMRASGMLLKQDEVSTDKSQWMPAFAYLDLLPMLPQSREPAELPSLTPIDSSSAFERLNPPRFPLSEQFPTGPAYLNDPDASHRRKSGTPPALVIGIVLGILLLLFVALILSGR